MDDYATHRIQTEAKAKACPFSSFSDSLIGQECDDYGGQETLAELEGPPRILMNWARNPKHYRIENTWDPLRFRSDVTSSKTPVGRLLAILVSLNDLVIGSHW